VFGPIRAIVACGGMCGGAPATAYEFLTNEMDLPPGVLAELYRRRWEIEKVYDELKNKLGQKKAWGSSLVAKETQGGSPVWLSPHDGPPSAA